MRRLSLFGAVAAVANPIIRPSQRQSQIGLLRTNEISRRRCGIEVAGVVLGGYAAPHAVHRAGAGAGVRFVESVVGAIAVAIVDLRRGDGLEGVGPGGVALDGRGGCR